MKQYFFAILLLVAANLNCADNVTVDNVTVTETATVEVTVAQPVNERPLVSEETEEQKEKAQNDLQTKVDQAVNPTVEETK